MLQTVDGHADVYVVDFDIMPELPITWTRSEEAPYAMALDAAIRNGVVTEPGKYGITINTKAYRLDYNIFTIKD